MLCEHFYAFDSEVYSTHVETDKKVTFSTMHKCVKCDKILEVNIDEEKQLINK
jgi:hypothetical protein